MGKKLIIKGADFSQNGMRETIVERKITTLYDKLGAAVVSWPVDKTTQTCYYFFSKGSNALKEGGNNPDKAWSGKIAVEDFTHVKVKTANQSLGHINDNVSGMILLAAVDSQNNILAGYCSSNSAEQVGDGVNLTPVGVDGSGIRTFELDIPSGAAYIVASWDSYHVSSGQPKLSPLDETNGFELILSKNVIE